MDPDSNEKQDNKISWQQRDGRLHVSIAHHFKSDANAGGWMLVYTLIRIGFSLYANWFSDGKSCVLERFVIFAIGEN